ADEVTEGGAVEAEEAAGAAGDDPEQAVQVVAERQVAGGVGEYGEGGPAAGGQRPVVGALVDDGAGEGYGPLQPGESGLVESGEPGLVEEGLELAGQGLSGEQLQDGEQRVGARPCPSPAAPRCPRRPPTPAP
ncbi:hypothetical protein ACFVH1_31835, partial [Streptomyces sp. NPDC127123]